MALLAGFLVALAICWHSAACFKNSSAGLIGVIGARFLGFPSLLDTIECRTRRTTRLLIPFERAPSVQAISSIPAHAFHCFQLASNSALAWSSVAARLSVRRVPGLLGA